MPRIAVSTLLAAPSIIAGSLFFAQTDNVRHLDYKLVDEAMVIIPVDNPAYADAAADLYLKAAGMTVDPDYANVSTLDMPEVVSGGGLNNAVDYGVNEVVTAIEEAYQDGDMADGPLYVFGYSQSSVVMGMAEQQLAAYDNGVLLGDPTDPQSALLHL